MPQPRRRYQQQVNSGQPNPQIPTPTAQFMANVTAMVPGNPMGRMGRNVPPAVHQVNAPQTALAAGNWKVTSDSRGAPAALPTGDGGYAGHLNQNNASPFPHAQVFTPSSLDSAGGHARTDAFQHGRLIARDRHIIANQGRVTSSNRQQATGGTPNPEASGPPRPTWKMFNRTLSHQVGVDSTANLDNGQYHAFVMVPGRNRRFPLATQGQEWSIRYGGTPGLANHRPYGYRGGFDDGAPLPTIRAMPGGPYPVRELLQVGAPGDGPQKVYGGLPWGLHSPTLPSRQHTQSVIRSRLGQVKPVWNVRPNNSKTAGQSWSQSMVSLSGQQAVKLKSTPPIRQPGLNARWLGA